MNTWHGCYNDGWNGLIVPEAFAHPAKYARGLIQRIIETGLDRGYWKAHDTIDAAIICGHGKGIRGVKNPTKRKSS